MKPTITTADKLRRFLYLYCSQWQWARKLHGGRWVLDKRAGGCWVSWNDEYARIAGWPLNCNEYFMEDWNDHRR